MKRSKNISGAVLPTAMVISVLLLLTVLAVASVWEADFLFFSKHRYDAMQRAHVESAFALYAEYPDDVLASLDGEGALLLFDSVPASRVKIKRKRWGLYEIVSVSGHEGNDPASKIVGRRTPWKDDAVMYYRNNNSAITLTGKTHLKGRIYIPRNGVVYSQMGSVFFSGEKIGQEAMKESDETLPEPEPAAVAAVKELQALRGEPSGRLQDDSLRHGFREDEPLVLEAGGRLRHCDLSGNIVLTGENIEIEASCRLTDIIVVGKKIRIKEGFAGSLQAFASDSLVVENRVALEYPSGLYSEKHIGIGDGSQVNGYAITCLKDEPAAREANYDQSRLSTVRGLVYVSGIAQLQGIVSGAVFLNKATYYSPRGYYENTICDATILENSEMAWPLWLAGPPERKEVKWVR